MKVVLNQDVRGTGKKGQIVEVSDGYARNYLMPKGLCKEATAQNINAAEQRSKADAHKAAQEKKQAEELAARMKGTTLITRVKTGEGGRLFGAVTNKEIAEMVKEKFGIDLDKKRIVIDEPIKRVGTYEVELKPYANVSCKVTVVVEAIEGK